MEVVSTAFQTASTADSRETKAQVCFLADSVGFNNDLVVAYSTMAEVGGTLDFKFEGDTTEPSRFLDKIASFEQDRIVLDGSFYLPRKTQTYRYWSGVISDENGEFTTNPYYQLTTESLYTIGDQFTILFGQDEYPIDYDIVYYDINTNLETSRTHITGNTSVQNTITITDDDSKVRIEIIKALPYRSIKITHIDEGFTKIYTDDDIVNVSITENNDYINLDLPNNECSVTIDNIAKEFDILNPTGNYDKLTDYAPMTIKMGHVTEDGVELIDMGRFYINEYTQDKSNMTFNAVDIIGKLDNTYFYGWGKQNASYSGLWETLDHGGTSGAYTIKEVIYRLMEKIGLRTGYWGDSPVVWNWINYFIVNSDLDIADTINDEPIGWTNTTTIQTARDLLKRIGITYGLKIWVDRDGLVRFDKNEFLKQTALGTYPTITNTIEIDQSKDYPTIEQQQLLKTIKLFSESPYSDGVTRTEVVAENTYTFQPLIDSTSNSSDYYIDIYPNKYVTELADFVSAPVITGSWTITDFIVYGWKIRIKATGGDVGGTATFAIDDVDYTISNQFNQVFENTSASTGYTLELYNDRIITYGGLSTIMNNLFLLSNYSKFVYTYNWRQSLINNLGDIVGLENNFGLTKVGTITYQKYDYNGGLDGVTKGVGV